MHDDRVRQGVIAAARQACDASGMIRAVLLDVDGTLVDSNDAHAQAWVQALAEAGHRVPFDRVRAAIGMGGDKLLPSVTGIPEESAEGSRVGARRREIFLAELLPRLRPFPHARDLCVRMRDAGLRLVVASSAKAEELEPLLRVARVQDLLEARTSSDDADRSKPDPDIVVAALRRAGCRAAEAIMLGDTPYDVEAATRAGVAVVAVRCGGWHDEQLGGASEIWDDPAALLAHYDASIIGRRGAAGAVAPA